MMELIHGLKMETELLHHIVFGNFDSKDFELYLAGRNAPTPPERQITVSVPYRHGVIDLSHLRGERIYDNREITYTFYRFGLSRNAEAGMVQTTLENLLMGEFEQTLYDSYEPFFHYKGKCTGVSAQDDFEYGRLVIEVVFQLYPFKVSNAPESWDLFDGFNFNLDVMQTAMCNLRITSGETIQIMNPGRNACDMLVTASKAMSVQISKDMRFEYPDPVYELKAGGGNRVRLPPGENWLGWYNPGAAGYVTLDLYKERI